MRAASIGSGDTYRPPSSVALGYATTYWIPLVVIMSLMLGNKTELPDLFAYLPLVIAFLVIPVINGVNNRKAMSDSNRDRAHSSPGWQIFYRAVLLMSFPAQAAMYVMATNQFASDMLDWWGKLGLVLSTGIYGALFAVNIGHELIHRKQRLERWMGNVLLSTVSFGTFKVAHLRIHHRYVATPLDPSSAPRGQNLYAFWWQAVSGNSCSAFAIERSRLAEREVSLWRGELVGGYALSLLWLILSAITWGWSGGLFFVLQSVIAVLKLELFNYLQHYGIRRALLENGKFEPVRPCHSWSQDAQVTNRLLLNLTLHGDHHVNPGRRYERLRIADGSPRYPYDASIMAMLSLVPPLFRRVVHPCLDEFQAGPDRRS